MRIVVTGALGHIGSRLIRDVPQAIPASDIRLLDNLATERYCSLFDLPGNGRYRFLEADILTADLATIIRGADVVVHLAAMTDDSRLSAEDIQRVNCDGTERLARACVREGCALLFVSTTSIYNTQNGVVDEDAVVGDLQSQGAYTVSKWNAEQVLHRLGSHEDLRFVICRFGTIVGASPGMRFHTAVNRFCWQAVTGRPLTVWRTALHQERPYLDLGDAVAALHFIIERHLFDRRIYNIVSLNATVSHVVDAIAAYAPNPRVEHIDSPLMNDCSYRTSTRQFTSLGFQFTGTLERGIGDTIRLFRALRALKPALPQT